MAQLFRKSQQAYGEFNNGDIIENKPIGFPQDNGKLKPYSNIFYWAHAVAKKDSTIGLHPHKGFEIMTIVLKGKIIHFDTLMNKWITLNEGDIQLIQSCSGISHAEAMMKDAEIFQIWFNPDLRKVLQKPPSYLDVKKNELPKENNLTTIIGKNSPFKLDSEDIYITLHNHLNGEHNMDLDAEKYYSIYVIEGQLNYKNLDIKKDDFLLLSDESVFNFNAKNLTFLSISSPLTPSYPVY